MDVDFDKVRQTLTSASGACREVDLSIPESPSVRWRFDASGVLVGTENGI
jgi:hypothetical protein